jgi:enoyl-CoA hydratase/carnithine racemase
MNQELTISSITTVLDGHVAGVRIDAPPYNFVNVDLLRALAESLEALDEEVRCRVIVLTSTGRTFCAGADFSGVGESGALDPRPLYAQAMRLFGTRKPIVAAVQGAAIGAGLGLALAADFRIGCAESRFSANFTRLGFHPGFGLTHTLPATVGPQNAARMFYSGERISAARAHEIRLLDELVASDRLYEAAHTFAREIARSAPMAVQLTRETLRFGLAQKVRAANERECALQLDQFAHADFREGVSASAARRLPHFADRQLTTPPP